MKAHFVTFYSPGTFVAETNTEPVDSWDVEAAQRRAAEIVQRHGAVPYGFEFTTRGRSENDLDSKVVETSPFYWLGGKISTLAEVEARALPDEKILLSNMRCNGYARVITTTKGWKWTQPLKDTDIVLAESEAAETIGVQVK